MSELNVKSFKLSLVRHMMESANRGDFRDLAAVYGLATDSIKSIWARMCSLSLEKLQLHLQASEMEHLLDAAARITDIEWMVIDVILLYDHEFKLVSEENWFYFEQQFNLEFLFELVQKNALEDFTCLLNERALQAAWLKIHEEYLRHGKKMSLIGLQHRWHEMKIATVQSFQKYWHDTSTDWDCKRFTADFFHPPYLQRIIANRFPHLITSSLADWIQLVRERKILISKDQFSSMPVFSSIAAPSGNETSQTKGQSVVTSDKIQETETVKNDVYSILANIDPTLEIITKVYVESESETETKNSLDVTYHNSDCPPDSRMEIRVIKTVPNNDKKRPHSSNILDLMSKCKPLSIKVEKLPLEAEYLRKQTKEGAKRIKLSDSIAKLCDDTLTTEVVMDTENSVIPQENFYASPVTSPTTEETSDDEYFPLWIQKPMRRRKKVGRGHPRRRVTEDSRDAVLLPVENILLRDPILTQSELFRMLQELQFVQSSPRRVYCCKARRHRIVNYARRRQASKQGRRYKEDKPIHIHGSEDCNCCCRHLLDISQTQLKVKILEMDHHIQSLIDPRHVSTTNSNQEQTSSNNVADQQVSRTKVLQKQAEKDPKSKILTKDGEDEDLREWIRQRNLGCEVFGFKPLLKLNKRTQKYESEKPSQLKVNKEGNLQKQKNNSEQVLKLNLEKATMIKNENVQLDYETETQEKREVVPNNTSVIQLTQKNLAEFDKFTLREIKKKIEPKIGLSESSVCEITDSEDECIFISAEIRKSLNPSLKENQSKNLLPNPKDGPSVSKTENLVKTSETTLEEICISDDEESNRNAEAINESASTSNGNVPDSKALENCHTLLKKATPHYSFASWLQGPKCSLEADPISVQELIEGKDPTKLVVFQVDHTLYMWQLTQDIVLVTGVNMPCARCEYWTQGPSHRRLDLQDLQFGDKNPSTFVEDIGDRSISTLRIRKTPSLISRHRIIISKAVYLKLSNQPLLYAQVLTPVPDITTARQLLLNGAALYFYNRTSGVLTQLSSYRKSPQCIAICCQDNKEALTRLLTYLNILSKNYK